MRQVQGPLYRDLQEQIVVLREQDQAPEQNLPDHNYIFGDRSYPKDRFIVLVSREDNYKVVIQESRTAVDASGIPISSADYVSVLIPPNKFISTGDTLIRIEKGNQRLQVVSNETILNIQRIELDVRGVP